MHGALFGSCLSLIPSLNYTPSPRLILVDCHSSSNTHVIEKDPSTVILSILALQVIWSILWCFCTPLHIYFQLFVEMTTVRPSDSYKSSLVYPSSVFNFPFSLEKHKKDNEEFCNPGHMSSFHYPHFRTGSKVRLKS